MSQQFDYLYLAFGAPQWFCVSLRGDLTCPDGISLSIVGGIKRSDLVLVHVSSGFVFKLHLVLCCMSVSLSSVCLGYLHDGSSLWLLHLVCRCWLYSCPPCCPTCPKHDVKRLWCPKHDVKRLWCPKQ